MRDYQVEELRQWAAENRTLAWMADKLGTYYRRVGELLDQNGIPRPIRDRTKHNNPNYRNNWDLRKHLLQDWAQSGVPITEMLRRLKCNHRSLKAALIRFGIQVAPPNNQGPKNPAWRGGEAIQKGYLWVYAPDHPNRSRHNKVAKHRLVMEEKIGRLLERHEVVHHIDGNTLNNHPDNLELFQSNGEHLAATLKGKCPNWTEEGRQRIRTGKHNATLRARERDAMAQRESCAHSPTSPPIADNNP